jgi:hypothetical protein
MGQPPNMGHRNTSVLNMTDETTPKPKPSKPRASKPKAGPTMTPMEWCNYLQRYTLGPKVGKLRRKRNPHWQHAAASTLHGWAQHAHDANEPIKLTEAAYKGALAAVEKTPLKPHKAALSPHCKHSFTE